MAVILKKGWSRTADIRKLTHECCIFEMAPAACLTPAVFKNAVNSLARISILLHTERQHCQEKGPDNSFEAGIGFFICQNLDRFSNEYYNR